MIIYPNFDPVAVEIGGLSIHWYGIMYLLGLGIAGGIGSWLLKKASFSSLRGLLVQDLIAASAVGVIIGGRLGYVLFYNLSYYLDNPLHIVYLWSGGMSFHGGLIGVILSLWVLARIHAIPDIDEILEESPDGNSDINADDKEVLTTVTSHKNIFLRLVDLAAVITPPGLGLGRLGNFINGELPGRVTSADLPWAMSFGNPDYLPRHPSQLYQLFIEGFILTALMLYLSRVSRAPGWLAGVFLLTYSVGRFFVEFFREPDSHLGLIVINLTMGQLLCIPMFLLGLVMIYRLKISAWLVSMQNEEGKLAWKNLFYKTFAAESDANWDAHEKAFAENYSEEREEAGGISAFFSRLFSGNSEQEEEEWTYTKVVLTRQQKRRLKKKKRKK